MISGGAIETWYKGCRFRSRLEARWAVFFDTLGVKWTYEKQGYMLNGMPYLPDFWFDYPFGEGWGFWLEVKPEPLTDAERDLLAALAKATGHRAFAVCGQPWPGDYSITVFQHHHGGEPERIPLLEGGELIETKWCDDPDAIPELFVRRDEKTFPFLSNLNRARDGGLEWVNGEPLSAAFGKARSARFEHGERS